MYTAPHDPKKGAPPLAVAATYHQIYSNVAGLSYTRGGDNALLQAAATVYLNALEWPVDYHVKAPMCLKLFDVAAGNQSILDNGHKTSWDAGMCRQYLKTLAGL
ncbi:hypothetical protein ASF43_24615 [Pseudorhodoferax sp. Leaf267]|nr:hypothetical protein ASF43_24615 [Pseudorhodoferax sp. Leaf267]